jgi:hypothetical protein
MPVQPLIILGHNFSREEAAEIRRFLDERGRSVVLANATAHTPGQDLLGDVVVIGDGAPDAERDCKGTFKRYQSMDAFRQARTKHAGDSPLPAQTVSPQPEPTQESPPPSQKTPMIDLDRMTRLALIQYAAQKHPRKRSWATLRDDDIKAALRELEAGD